MSCVIILQLVSSKIILTNTILQQIINIIFIIWQTCMTCNKASCLIMFLHTCCLLICHRYLCVISPHNYLEHNFRCEHRSEDYISRRQHLKYSHYLQCKTAVSYLYLMLITSMKIVIAQLQNHSKTDMDLPPGS